MTNTDQPRIPLRDMIFNVITDSDPSRVIMDKIIDEYPDYLERKIAQRGSEHDARIQIYAEISSLCTRGEGKFFDIDRTGSTFTYSKMNNDNDNDNDDDNVEIDIADKTDKELGIGYVYILDTHVDVDGRRILKIGKANDIDKRIKQLDSEQSSYQKHTVICSWKVDRPYKAEHAIHNTLDHGRLNPKKEGFYGDYVEDNMSVVETIISLFTV
jgi:hypothetical protein